MYTNIVKSMAAVAALGALSAACTLQTADPGESDEQVATTAAELPADVGVTFEHILSHNQPWNKSTNVCELTIPNVNPATGAHIQMADVVNGTIGANIGVQGDWSGGDAHVDYFGKPKDRFDVTGCNAGGDCRLTIRVTTKGNSFTDYLGCIIQVDLPTITYQGWSNGNMVQGMSSEASPPWYKAQGRQKLHMNLDETALSSQCTPRVYSSTGVTDLAAGFYYWINYSDLGGLDNSTDSVPTFPTVLDPSGLVGTWKWGTDTNSSRAKHALSFDFGLVPGDWVWCQSYATADTAARSDGVLMNLEIAAPLDPPDQSSPGMTLRTFAPSAAVGATAKAKGAKSGFHRADPAAFQTK